MLHNKSTKIFNGFRFLYARNNILPRRFVKNKSSLPIERSNFPRSNFSAEFYLKTFQGNILSIMPNLRDMSHSDQSMLFHSLDKILSHTFNEVKGGEKISTKKMFLIDGQQKNQGKFVIKRKLEYVTDETHGIPIAMVVHEYVENCDFDRPIIFYHPRIWAIKHIQNSDIGKAYTGLGIIPLLMTRFAYYLQLNNPSIPCYMAIPVFSPWVLRMVRTRFGISFPADIEGISSALNRDQEMIVKAAMSSLKYEGGNYNNEPSLSGYPLYKLPYQINEGFFENTYYSTEESRKAIEVDRYFCQRFLRSSRSKEIGSYEDAYDARVEKFRQNGFLSIIPCSPEVLEHFTKSIIQTSMDYTRIFGLHLPPDDLFLDSENTPLFMRDLSKLYYFNRKNKDGVRPGDRLNPDINTFRGVDLLLRRKGAEHISFSGRSFEWSEKDKKPANQSGSRQFRSIEANQKIESLDSGSITIDGRLPSTFLRVRKKNNEIADLFSEIYKVSELSASRKAIILDQIWPLLNKSFSGGKAIEIKEFKKRFDRPHAYIELIVHGGKMVGFLFHEPFWLRLKTEAGSSSSLKVAVLKSGIGCLAEDFQGIKLLSFFIRRFLFRLQIHLPGVPCFHHFIASSPHVLQSELNIIDKGFRHIHRSNLFIDGFHPRPRMQGWGFSQDDADISNEVEGLIDPLPPETRELVYAIFCAEIRLKYHTGGTMFAGMFRHVRNLSLGIPYPLVPKLSGLGHTEPFVFSLYDVVEEKIEEKKKDGKFYGMQLFDDKGNQALAAGIRCFSRFSPTRAEAYGEQDYPRIIAFGPDRDGYMYPLPGKSVFNTAVNLLCTTGESRELFSGGIKKIIPANQGQANHEDCEESSCFMMPKKH